jgi:hypothetical protein
VKKLAAKLKAWSLKADHQYNGQYYQDVAKLCDHVLHEDATDAVLILEQSFDALSVEDRPDKFMPLKREFIKRVSATRAEWPKELKEQMRQYLCKMFIWSKTKELPKDECASEVDELENMFIKNKGPVKP